MVISYFAVKAFSTSFGSSPIKKDIYVKMNVNIWGTSRPYVSHITNHDQLMPFSPM
uniref:Uncharacterized protein n=1 Tax=Anguilla anguilla TaxID=7936 RepID=A0A0E9WF60_ANGAN